MADVNEKRFTNVRIQHRTKTSAEWLAVTEAPLKGELCVELNVNESGSAVSTKIKIGDGHTLFKDLAYVGGNDAHVIETEVLAKGADHMAAINALAGSLELHAGDIAIAKEKIDDNTDGKLAYTAYVYDGEAWKAMDGNYSADNVYFDADLTYTANIGTKTVPASGSGTISAKGKNVKQVLSDILALEKNPTKTVPAVSFSAQGGFGTFEIGTKKTLTYTAALSAGSYTYGPATGITAQSWNVVCDGKTLTTATGSFTNIVAESTPKNIVATATYNEGAIPKTNLGNDYPAGKITAGSASKTSSNLTGVRYMFYGPMTTDAALNSASIRALGHKEASASKTIATFGAGAGAVKVVVAVPSGKRITKVLMPSAMNADVTTAFVQQSATVDVEGAEGYTATAYTVYVYQPASIDAGETYAITIG